MSKQIDALKLAEESLEGWKEYDTWTDQQMWNDDDEEALAAIREALAEQALQNLSDFHQHMEATEPEYYDCGGTIGVVHKSQCSAAMKRNGKPMPEGFRLHNERMAEIEADPDKREAIEAARNRLRGEPVKQEPVAYAPIITFRDSQLYQVSKQLTPEFCNPLYAAPVDAKAIRAEALEEAAKVCDEPSYMQQRAKTSAECAAAIRGLK